MHAERSDKDAQNQPEKERQNRPNQDRTQLIIQPRCGAHALRHLLVDRHCLTDKVHPGYQARAETGRPVGSPGLEPPAAATGITRRRAITLSTVIEPKRGRSTR
jgi:hypothetical protein